MGDEMTPDDLFDSLAENAFDFLERALGVIKKRPKYSVIHFYSAIELFLKARLLKEHWSLVVATRRQDLPDWEKFERGDFISVSLKEAKQKLDKVVRTPLKNSEMECFAELGQHRNRAVHFFHPDTSDEAKEKHKQSIVKQQLRAWLVLHDLLTVRWKSEFEKYSRRLSKIHSKMKKLRGYLRVVYERLKVTIDKGKKSGEVYIDCPSCGFESIKLDREIEGGPDCVSCLVCGYQCTTIEIECSNEGCESMVRFFEEGFSSCKGCGEKYEPEDLLVALGGGGPFTKDDLIDYIGPITCVYCSGVDTVIDHCGWFCVNCFESFNYEDFQQCDWCGSYAACDMSDSHLFGCIADCGGSAEWNMDKD